MGELGEREMIITVSRVERDVCWMTHGKETVQEILTTKRM